MELVEKAPRKSLRINSYIVGCKSLKSELISPASIELIVT